MFYLRPTFKKRQHCRSIGFLVLRVVRCFLELKVILCIDALLGVHLVDPILTLTISTVTILFAAFQQLYLDLLKTEPCKLLNSNKDAFTFVNLHILGMLLKYVRV